MKGDFSRDTFNQANHFVRVLMQQGRVQLDADWNEQTSILLYYLKSLARDLIGPHGGHGFALNFVNEQGDEISNIDDLVDIKLASGNYYVHGLLCENGTDARVPVAEPDPLHFPKAFAPDRRGNYLFYLDVWERHLTYVQNDDIREKALNGPDTTTRSQLIWQIGFQQTDKKASDYHPQTDLNKYESFLADLGIGAKTPIRTESGTGTGKLLAQTRKSSAEDSGPCILSPESKYRGPENQLYRVEINSSGVARSNSSNSDKPVATWKWSRDNGTVVFPIRRLVTEPGGDTTTVTLEHLGRDERSKLSVGDWVEVVDDTCVLTFKAGHLLKVVEIRENDLQAVLQGNLAPETEADAELHPLLRRWNQKPTRGISLTKSGVIEVEEGKNVELECGIVVQFEHSEGESTSFYRVGDYWYIPARVATGDIEWPVDKQAPGKPAYIGPRGIEHYFSPLAHVGIAANGDINNTDLRRRIEYSLA